ncbi:MAG TPA: hypothetical protein ENO08_02770 [Candidatus Eisenbacteria bacterium]|uniref:Uncharacterized protein n=1 Tax=Eiseniibacteriota bacterium TaxID=2212470 RepID=A0A7V2AU90_UNCEI|nr:hypothetical protein [Candidatus Eisenbacteria bacterium]
MYERIREIAGRLGPQMALFAREIAAAAGTAGHGEGPGGLIERHMASMLSYDLVFHDPAGNIIGVLVGADEGFTVLLRSSAAPGGTGRAGSTVPGPGIADTIASHVYAGHILGDGGMLRRGTVVVACSCAGEALHDEAGRLLMEDTLPGLGIFPGITILEGAGDDGPAGPEGDPVETDRLVKAASEDAILAYRLLT